MQRYLGTRAGKLTNEFGWVGVAMALQLIGQVATIKVLTNLLVPSEYGEINLVNSVLQLVELVLFFPFLQAAGRFSPEYRPVGGFFSPFWLVRRFHWVIYSIIALGAAVAVVLLSVFHYNHLVLLLIVGIVLLWFEITREHWLTIAHVDRQRKIIALFRAADVWGRLLAVFLLLRIFPTNALFVLISWSCLSAAIVIPLRRLVLRATHSIESNKHSPIPELREQVFNFAIPFAVVSIFTWMQTWADRWVLSAFMGQQAVGTLAVATQLGSIPFNSLSGVLINFAGPIIYQMIGASKDEHTYRRVGRALRTLYLAYVLISLLGLGLIYLISVHMLPLVLGRSFKAASVSPLLILEISVAWMILNLSQLQSLSITTAGDTSRLVAPNVVGGLSVVIFNILLIPRLGIWAPGLSLAIASTLRGVMLAVMTRDAWRDYTTKHLVQRKVVPL